MGDFSQPALLPTAKKMKRTCKKCGSEIKELDFQEEVKLEIWGMINQGLILFAIKKLIDEYKFSHKEAKVITAHINKEFGKCHNCHFENLTEENIECPKCKSFNYNLNIATPFDKGFCTHLERRLNFDKLENDEIIGYWCDGIDHLPRDLKSLSKKNIEKNKRVNTIAWIGKDGQGEYEMEIIFGNESIANYQKNKSLVDCIPEENFKDWIKIEPEKKRIQIKLK